MFYNIIKNFFIKKYIKKKLAEGLVEVNHSTIKTIGLLVDLTYFSKLDNLLHEFATYSNGNFEINLLVFRKKASKNEIISYAYYTKSDIGISGKILKTEVEQFIDYPFDMLVNYYDTNNTDLQLVSVLSKANFKVGFESVNKSIHHFFIKTYIEKYQDFTKVLFDYLKILKKI